MSEYTVHLIGGGDDETASIITSTGRNPYQLIFRLRDKTLEVESTDFFEACGKIRTQLENDSLIPFCYGASLNVFPSGMCRDMSGGLKAYRLTIGKKPIPGDLVGIFDECPDVIPASVARQKEHFEEWRKSIMPGV